MTALETRTHARPASDQASRLRDLMGAGPHANTNPESGPVRFSPKAHVCRSVAVVGDKGGVGRSQIALNLAVTFAAGSPTLLVDAHEPFAQLPLLARGAAAMTSQEWLSAAVPSSDPLTLITSGRHFASLSEAEAARFAERESACGWAVIDVGTRPDHAALSLCVACTDWLLVGTPDPASVAETYSTLKRLCGFARDVGSEPPPVALLLNRCLPESGAERVSERLRRTALDHLGIVVRDAGICPEDDRLRDANRLGRPLASADRSAPFSASVRGLAAGLIDHSPPPLASASLTGRLPRS